MMHSDFLFRPFNIHGSNKGQSVIEFLVCFTVIFGILVIYITIGLNATAGFFTQYAAYMASRAYMVFDNNLPDEGNDRAAENTAKEVFRLYEPNKTLNIVKPPEGEGEGEAQVEYIGVYSDFEQQFSLAPGFAGKITMPMRSESFLGREPSREYCLKRIMSQYSDAGWVSDMTNPIQLNLTVDDNGC